MQNQVMSFHCNKEQVRYVMQYSAIHRTMRAYSLMLKVRC